MMAIFRMKIAPSRLGRYKDRKIDSIELKKFHSKNEIFSVTKSHLAPGIVLERTSVV